MMTRYKIVSPLFTLGEPGDIVDDDALAAAGVNVQPLVKCRVLVEVVAKPRKAAAKKATDESEG